MTNRALNSKRRKRFVAKSNCEITSRKIKTKIKTRGK
jgi:hypothetical protein